MVSIIGFISNVGSQAMAPAYTITDLGTLGGSPNQSRGYGINNCGTAVGDSIAPGGVPVQHPFYKKGATMTDLGTLGSDGTGYSVNSLGYAVGYSTSSVQRAVFWHDDDGDGISDPGELHDFLPAGASGVAYEVNDNNRVVGAMDASGGQSLSDTPFVWDATSGFQSLPAPPAGMTLTRALGITNAGTIAGWAAVSPSGRTHAFILKNSTYIDLGTLDNTDSSLQSFASRISEDNHVVGYSQVASNNALITFHPFVWFDANSNNTSDAGEMKDLGTLSGTNAYAYDINASGYVAGTSEITVGSNATHAFVWHDDNANGVNDPGEMKDLNGEFSDATWTTLVEAHSINDGGQIVGWGTKSNGETHAFLLTPTGFTPPPCPGASPSPSPTPTPATTSLISIQGNGTYGGTATLAATLYSNDQPVAGKTISFTLNSVAVCGGVSQPVCPTTDASGIATLSGVSLAGINAGNHPGAVGASFAGDALYASTSGSGTLIVSKATPTITWNNPGDIVYGTALSSTQLNATASVPGTFVYTPLANTVLHAGNGQTLHVDFTPADSTNYATASKNVLINVLKATLTITADNKMKLVGDPNPPLTFTPTGFVNGDTASVLTGSPSLSTTATNSSPVGNYPITITQGTLAASDYAFSFVNGTLSVTEPTPVILLETGTNNAAALDSVTFVRGPFKVTDNFNFSGDNITRIIIFTSPLGFVSPPIPPTSSLLVRASGIDLPVESVGSVTGVSGLSASYIVVRLVPGMPTGDLQLTVTRNGVMSNPATLTIVP